MRRTQFLRTKTKYIIQFFVRVNPLSHKRTQANGIRTCITIAGRTTPDCVRSERTGGRHSQPDPSHQHCALWACNLRVHLESDCHRCFQHYTWHSVLLLLQVHRVSCEKYCFFLYILNILLGRFLDFAQVVGGISIRKSCFMLHRNKNILIGALQIANFLRAPTESTERQDTR